MTAKTSTERSRERRERLRQKQITEVRGIHAPSQHHEEIRQAARKVAAKLDRAKKGTQ